METDRLIDTSVGLCDDGRELLISLFDTDGNSNTTEKVVFTLLDETLIVVVLVFDNEPVSIHTKDNDYSSIESFKAENPDGACGVAKALLNKREEI